MTPALRTALETLREAIGDSYLVADLDACRSALETVNTTLDAVLAAEPVETAPLDLESMVREWQEAHMAWHNKGRPTWVEDVATCDRCAAAEMALLAYPVARALQPAPPETS